MGTKLQLPGNGPERAVVVGSGPAGSVAAAVLARRGLPVTLVDRQRFPRDKVCGDGVPPGSVEILDRIGAGPAVRAAGFTRIHGIRVVSPRGQTWQTGLRARHEGLGFFVAPRIQFDSILRDHAIACGAQCVHGTVRELCRDGSGRVTGVRVSEHGREKILGAFVVIGADGATSRVARDLGAGAFAATLRGVAGSTAVAARQYVEGIETVPDTVEFYFHRFLLPGYGWIFPLGRGRANVGVLVPAEHAHGKSGFPSRHLDQFLSHRSVAPRLRASARCSAVETWQLPCATPRRISRSAAGVLLVGDAASLVDPLTGEGIHAALVSGELAGNAAADAMNGLLPTADMPARYEIGLQAALGPLIARAWSARHFIEHHPIVLEALFWVARIGAGAVRHYINRISSDFVAARPVRGE